MRLTASGPSFSATDLSAFSDCRHLTLLSLGVAEQKLQRPGVSEIETKLLEKRGREHEKRVLELFEQEGRSIVKIVPGSNNAADDTLRAMRDGTDIVYQGVLIHGAWTGWPDFLVKSASGAYEPWDAKLSRIAKSAGVLQLCSYADAVESVFGTAPDEMRLILGGQEPTTETLRADDYMAYFRRAKAELEEFLRDPARSEPYPEPVPHCSVCVWWKRCADRRRDDDHLSLVANSSRVLRERLVNNAVRTVRDLASMAPSLRVPGIADVPLARLREQARIQVAGRDARRVLHELLTDFEPGTGLEALPEPRPGDLFFDLEGDAFFDWGSGLEYLFGVLELGQPDPNSFDERTEPGQPKYLRWWATNRADEKVAFEQAIDRIAAGRTEFPDLHVFHYGHREVDAVKRLSCFHKTRESIVDDLLRDHVFVDLHRVVRHSLRASVESYSLKRLEPLYAFERNTDLREASRAMHLFSWLLETGGDDPDLRNLIEAYNREDCVSTWKLRDFLEGERSNLGRRLTRPNETDGEGEERRKKRETDTALEDAVIALTRDLPADPGGDDAESGARRLLASLLDWHWREGKASWWEYHRAREVVPSDRLDDRTVLADLRYTGVVGQVKRSLIHRYEFPLQTHGIRRGERPLRADTLQGVGQVYEIAPGYIDLKIGKGSDRPEVTALIPAKPIDTDVLKSSLLNLAQSVIRDGFCGAPRSLLLRAGLGTIEPKLATETDGDAILRITSSLDGGVMGVQGPPGSGKTYQAAHLIGELIRQKKRIGVSANSHVVILNLLNKVIDLGLARRYRVLHFRSKDSIESVDIDAESNIDLGTDHSNVRAQLDRGLRDLVGGTAWFWAHDALRDSVDYLIVDEAGQLSLANALSAVRATKNLVLIGDPTQLEQPSRGVHPPGADVSALGHLLGEAATLPAELGLFLGETRRLHPEICHFTSKLFYRGRLAPMAGLERQRIHSRGRLDGAGLRYVPVRHQGNSQESPEEVACIRDLVSELLSPGNTYTDEHGQSRPLVEGDVLVVAPYNRQVDALRAALPAGVLVGTVDKFQGQEAPVVFYSMATSTHDEAPRGLEFLFSASRLNVATSRARALVALVASPELLRATCRSPRQMKLANAVCAYVEMAESVIGLVLRNED